MYSLNSQQRQAVLHLGSPLLVIAGAGSGKTGVIAHKIAHLINEDIYRAPSIYAVTFTNKAAREMQQRVKQMLAAKARGIKICTFHSLGLDFLQREYHAADLRPRFSLFDTIDGHRLLKSISHQEDNEKIKEMRNAISRYKNAFLTPQEVADLAQSPEQRQLAQIYENYQNRLISYNAVDFDDLLLLPLRVLIENHEVQQRWQQKIGYLLVDEYQDTNDCQYQLLRVLTGNRAAFTAVGDDDQSIYSWRGAQAENINQLQRDYRQLTIIALEQNYRCDKRILDVANALIANNAHLVDKKLWSQLDYNKNPVIVSAAKNEYAEAENVANDILIKQLQRENNYGDFAILYRSNFQARVVEEKLRELNIAYHVNGGVGFFEHSEIRDLISYLRLINNCDDDVAFLRVCNVPKREIGDSTIKKLIAHAAAREHSLSLAATEIALQQIMGDRERANLNQFGSWLHQMRLLAQSASPLEILNTVIDAVDYEDYLFNLHKEPRQIEKRKERIASFKNWIAKLQENNDCDTLEKIMQRISLLDILDNKANNALEKVQLMTLHAAKGLEFKYVYIIGVEEDLLPHVNSCSDELTLAEERRLLYVGLTRAKRGVTLSYCKQRRRGGMTQQSDGSRFLQELPEKQVLWNDGRKIDEEQREEQRKQLFADLNAIFDND